MSTIDNKIPCAVGEQEKGLACVQYLLKRSQFILAHEGGTYLGTRCLRINKPSERARASGKMGILFSALLLQHVQV